MAMAIVTIINTIINTVIIVITNSLLIIYE